MVTETDTTKLNGRVLLLANGQPPGAQLWSRLASAGWPLFCVDGGANTARKLKAHPCAIIGDWDSLTQETRKTFTDTLWIEAPDQELTDLDKALGWLVSQGAQTISITGALGKRTDHMLANIELLLKYREKASITCHSSLEDLFLLDGRWECASKRGRRISLMPIFGRTIIKTEGLLYPLNRECLEPGVRDGVSNQALGGMLSVESEGNPVLICVARPRGADFVFAPPMSR